MKYFKRLLTTKPPSKERLLDIALILSIIPHLFVMKFFMLLYIVIAIVFIYKKSSKKYLLMTAGLLLITLSFFTSYNFSDFSRMQFFVSLISSLLIFAITLQKLTSEVNVYLKVSPILLMVLSFFFFNSILMLIYSITTLYLFTLLYVWSKMKAELVNAIAFTAKLFIAAIPLVTILFLVFPRISIEKSEFGFRADKYVDSGYDGEMRVSSNAINLSNKIIMEVLFQDANVTNSQLYFRGSTLSKQKGLEWLKDTSSNAKDVLSQAKNVKEYEASVYPHAKNWVYSLDMPLLAPKKTKLKSDYTISSDKPLYEKKKFILKSAIEYKLFSSNLNSALVVDVKKSPRVYRRLKTLRENNVSAKEKAYELLAFFKKQNIAYTLKPTNTDLDNFTDSFLLDSKNGYCVHFASAFASTARMIGVPSRVVTGFKADKKNMINNYLLVKSSDAHAWVELYFKKDGWLRFDPTSTASSNLSELAFERSKNILGNSYLTKVNHYFLYTKYVINNWILDYNRTKQLAILDKLLNDTLYLLKFVFALLLLIAITTLVFISVKTNRCKDKIVCETQKLFKAFKKHGVVKKKNESMQEFLAQTQASLGVDLNELNRLYHQLKYKENFDETLFLEFKKELKRLTRKVVTKESA